MSYLKFNHLDALLAFLCACEDRRTELGRRGRVAYERVWLVRRPNQNPQFALPLTTPQCAVDDPALADYACEPGYGAEVCPGPAPGTVEHVNEVLKRIPLRARRQAPGPLANLVVAMPVSAQTTVAHEQLVIKAWRDIPRRDTSRVRCYLARDEQERPAWFVAEVTDVRAGFDYDRWRDRNKEPRLKLLAPAWTGRCFLFVEWGYEHPRAQEFFQLFDEQDKAQGLDDDAVLLALAGDELSPAHDHTVSDEHLFCRPEWVAVTEPLDERSEGVWGVTATAAPETQVLVRRPPDDTVVDVPISVQDTRTALGSLAHLDQRISRAERELEELVGRRSRVRHMLQSEFVPVYAFESAQADAIPATLERFLDQPLGELATYGYLRHQEEGAGAVVHFLVGTVPVAMGTALAMSCSRVYLQDRRWQEWDVPLFVRSDCVLHPDLAEQEVAEQFWEALQARAGLPEGTAAVLVEQGLAPAADGARALRLIPLAEGRPLEECLAFVNAGREAPATMQRLNCAFTEATAVCHTQTVDANLLAAGTRLQERAKNDIDRAEKAWEEVRDGARRVLTAVRIADLALRVTAHAYEQAPSSWKAFVDNVVQTDGEVAALKLAAAAKWGVDAAALEARAAAIAQNYANLPALLAAAEEALEERSRNLARQHAELLACLERLEARRAGIDTQVKGLRDAHLAAEAACRQRKDQLETHRQELARVAKARQELMQATEKLEQAEPQTEAGIAALEVEIRRAQTTANTVRAGIRSRLADARETPEQSTERSISSQPPKMGLWQWLRNWRVPKKERADEGEDRDDA